MEKTTTDLGKLQGIGCEDFICTYCNSALDLWVIVHADQLGLITAFGPRSLGIYRVPARASTGIQIQVGGALEEIIMTKDSCPNVGCTEIVGFEGQNDVHVGIPTNSSEYGVIVSKRTAHE